MTLRECKMQCLKNCSCTAYSNLDIRGDGSGCLLWFNELIDMRKLNEDRPDIYIRMASSELGYDLLASFYKRVVEREGANLFPTSRLQWQEKRDSGSDLGIVNWTSSARYKPDRVSSKKEDEELTAEQRRNSDAQVFGWPLLCREVGLSGGTQLLWPTAMVWTAAMLWPAAILGAAAAAMFWLAPEWIIQAWKLYNEGKSLELIDQALWDSCYQIEMLRSIYVGLLCVQESPEDRASMSSIVLMLGSEAALPQAKQPGFFTARNVFKTGSSSRNEAITMGNEITSTLLSAR
ncbi:hypothetical protein ACSBR2_011874 [Camellia fascicularis]